MMMDLRSAVSMQHRSVSDGRKDGRTEFPYMKSLIQIYDDTILAYGIAPLVKTSAKFLET